MKIFYFIIVLILIVLGILVWINFTERKAETVFSSDGIEIRVLEAEVQGVLLRIVEPNGELSIFSEKTKKEALTGTRRTAEDPLQRSGLFLPPPQALHRKEARSIEGSDYRARAPDSSAAAGLGSEGRRGGRLKKAEC